MIRTVAIAAGALALALTTTAWAESITGRVRSYDPGTRVLTLEDGRILHLEPGATLTVNGQTVTLDRLTPGMGVTVEPIPAPGPSAARAGQWVGHPAIEASGVVTGVDRRNGTVTFQDGRTVKTTDRTRVWEQGSLASVKAGDRIHLTGALPLAYGSAAIPARQYMGTVLDVDRGKARIALSDGRVVKITPQTRFLMEDRQVTVADLQPGDQLVITVQDPAHPATPVTVPRAPVTSTADDVSALPGEAVSIDATEVRIMRLPQTP
jgi:hypothetical protein